MQPNSYKTNGKRNCNPIGWFMSEKFDGIKARWVDGQLLTRSGLQLEAPEWFTEMLPKKTNIEGELYLGKNTFHKTASLRASGMRTKSFPGEVEWKSVVYHVFDIIDYEKTWIERQSKLKKLYPKNTQNISIVDWIEIKELTEPETMLDKIVKDGGEGIILANPWGMYEDGHVDQILKYKKMLDKEAIVLGYNYSGDRLESLNVKNVGTEERFRIGVGFSMKDRYDFIRRYPVGCMITYSYETIYPTGKPRIPIFKGVRTDL